MYRVVSYGIQLSIRSSRNMIVTCRVYITSFIEIIVRTIIMENMIFELQFIFTVRVIVKRKKIIAIDIKNSIYKVESMEFIDFLLFRQIIFLSRHIVSFKIVVRLIRDDLFHVNVSMTLVSLLEVDNMNPKMCEFISISIMSI